MENSRAHQSISPNHHQVILFPLPLQGHINPMIQLANILYNHGFAITIIHTDFNSIKSSNHPQFTFHSIPDGLLGNQKSTADPIALVKRLNINCVGPFQDCLAKILCKQENSKISCLITDSAWYSTQEVADKLKVRRIVLRTSSVGSFLSFVALPILREKGYLPIQDSRLEEPVLENPPLKVKDLHVIKTEEPEDLYDYIIQMTKANKSSSGLIFNTFNELEQSEIAELSQEFSVPIFPIGPFHKYFPASSTSLLPVDKTSISWLDKQELRSVLYVSFGSIMMMNETELLEVAWGLANCKRPFLWVVRPGLVRGIEWLKILPEGLLEMLNGRGCIVKWAPQQEVLAHPAVGGFWTHNGWNSTMESICEGVPMICSPSLGDQRVIARFVSHVWKVGLHLEYRFQRMEIVEAINRLLVGEEGKEMKDRMNDLKEKVNSSVKYGGPSYQIVQSLVDYMLSF